MIMRDETWEEKMDKKNEWREKGNKQDMEIMEEVRKGGNNPV